MLQQQFNGSKEIFRSAFPCLADIQPETWMGRRRRSHSNHQKGEVLKFRNFQFNARINTAISTLGFSTPTPIQQQAIPPILQAKDLLGIAQTGTGKTAAFMLPSIQRLLDSSARGTRVLVLAPTRELAEQTQEFTQRIIRGTGLKSLAVYGGVSKQKQVNQLRNGVDIIIACPGRLLDLVADRAVSLSRIEILVLDEADHMLDKGFLPDLRRIVKLLPNRRQSLVFSATMPEEMQRLAESILHNPVRIQIAPTGEKRKIAHTAYRVAQNRKTDLLLHLLRDNDMATTLIFTRTKYKARNLATRLEKAGFKATSLQGNLSQSRRQHALDGFRDGSFSILVATDIAARGIDVEDISHVVNFDMPDTTETYIHRSGRTGRAMRSGIAWSFVTPDDSRMRKNIERVLGQSMTDERIVLPARDRQGTPQQRKADAVTSRQQRPHNNNKKTRRTGARRTSTTKQSRSSGSTNVFGMQRKGAAQA
jgi:superfamily II DNA/RNA helicase